VSSTYTDKTANSDKTASIGNTAFIDRTKLLFWLKLAAMFGGFCLLLCEIRFEHRAVLVDDWRPWIPIIACGAMLVLIPLAGMLWERGGRHVLIATYLVCMLLGLLGLFFHAEGHLLQRLGEIFSVLTTSPEVGSSVKALHPPLLAPGAFCGLGLIGLIFCVQEK
jgi:hypothetical protein